MPSSNLSTVVSRMRSGVIALRASAILLIVVVATGGWGSKESQEPGQDAASKIRNAVFEVDGSLYLPVGYRQWEHVGTRIKPDGRSVLDGSQITTPQVMDTYVEPSAYDSFKKSGTWPDGAQIVKEISLIKTGDGCDNANFVCSTGFGSGIFQASYIGMGMMLKDSKRFPSAPGNWGYFAFRSDGSAYQRTATVRPQQQCAACHMKLASKTDYVFSNTHIGLAPANLQ